MKNRNGLLAGLILLALFTWIPVQVHGQDKRYDIPLDNPVYRGPADAPITIIEFLDFQ